MSTAHLDETAQAIVAGSKGLLAADETVSTLSKRFAAMEIESTARSRCIYREMLFTTPGIDAYIGGVIMHDETIHQLASSGKALVDVLTEHGMVPGIKVDSGAKPLAGAPDELVTEGLDGLRDRLKAYRQLGARFAKWRAVFRVRETLPSEMCLHANAHALARYAALCQEQAIVPIVEPEVLMSGTHGLARAQSVTERVLQAVFAALFDQRVVLEGMLLKPNMVIAGQACPRQSSVEAVAGATLGTLQRHVPPAVPAIVFLSGGQDHVLATQHLDAINRLPGPKPWKLSFSYGRALQDEAMEAWHGKDENIAAGQRAFEHRARCESAAVLGRYGSAMESALA